MGYIERYFMPTSVQKRSLYNTMNQVRAFLDATPCGCDCDTTPELLQVERDNTSQSYYGVYVVLLHSGLYSTCI